MMEKGRRSFLSLTAIWIVVMFFMVYTCCVILMPTTFVTKHAHTVLISWLILWILLTVIVVCYTTRAWFGDTDILSKGDQHEDFKTETYIRAPATGASWV